MCRGGGVPFFSPPPFKRSVHATVYLNAFCTSSFGFDPIHLKISNWWVYSTPTKHHKNYSMLFWGPNIQSSWLKMCLKYSCRILQGPMNLIEVFTWFCLSRKFRTRDFCVSLERLWPISAIDLRNWLWMMKLLMATIASCGQNNAAVQLLCW